MRWRKGWNDTRAADARNWPVRARIKRPCSARRDGTNMRFEPHNGTAMTGYAFLSANLLLAYSAYFVGTASPGPSNLAIMSIASRSGRRAAFAFAAGVMSGSFFWAMLAAYSGFLVAVKIAGGLYLLWLAFKSGRAAWKPKARAATTQTDDPSARRADASHQSEGDSRMDVGRRARLVGGTRTDVHARGRRGLSVHRRERVRGYAALFSMPSARRFYARSQRYLDAGLALVFGAAGLRLLTSRA